MLARAPLPKLELVEVEIERKRERERERDPLCCSHNHHHPPPSSSSSPCSATRECNRRNRHGLRVRTCCVRAMSIRHEHFFGYMLRPHYTYSLWREGWCSRDDSTTLRRYRGDMHLSRNWVLPGSKLEKYHSNSGNSLSFCSVAEILRVLRNELSYKL